MMGILKEFQAHISKTDLNSDLYVLKSVFFEDQILKSSYSSLQSCH